MYCRLQCYPAPRLISYKITGIRVLWGFVVPLCRLSIPVAQRLFFGHYVISRTQPNASRYRHPC